MRPGIAALAIALAIGTGIGACGGDDDAQQVRTALERFESAAAKRDYRALCRDLLSRSIVERVQRVNLRCEQALRIALEEVIQPRLTVEEVTVDGDRASARVTSHAAGEEESRDTVRLRKEDGRWKIASLAGA